MTKPKSNKSRPIKSRLVEDKKFLPLQGRYKGKGLLEALEAEKRRERGL
ncbi:MAG: hypothetical protein ACRESX_08390 [Gammaproteobacteria bacterium]